MGRDRGTTVTYISGGSAGYFLSKSLLLFSCLSLHASNLATVFLLRYAMQSGMGDERRLCVKIEWNQRDKLLRQPSKLVYDPKKKKKKKSVIWQRRFLTPKLEAQQSALLRYLIAHRFNVTQRLHSLDVIGCCSSNSVWFFIFCVWDATVSASEALRLFFFSTCTLRGFICSAMAYKYFICFCTCIWCWCTHAYKPDIGKAIC